MLKKISQRDIVNSVSKNDEMKSFLIFICNKYLIIIVPFIFIKIYLILNIYLKREEKILEQC